MLSRRFLFIVLLAFVIASPVAYYFMNNWLEGFAYHTIIKPMAFVLTVLVMIIIAGVTVGAQAWRAATTNPTEILRSE
ncbi:MAG: hypothetical protein U5K54_26130 [Cytophagales bacterium]|nr:hypothetical protein [Cytophagales bacterium]